MVLPYNANDVVGEVLNRVPVKAPAFAFLDPEGSELSWSTVKAIADHKRAAGKPKVEQLILLPVDMGFVRLMKTKPDLVTRIYGHDRWKAIHEDRQAGRITADGARTKYVQLYADGLRDLGYATVLDRQIARESGNPMYFLIFATDHPTGQKIMDWVFDRVRLRVADELGQGSLFAAPSTRIPRVV